MENLKIGWGRREISVEGPVNMPGQLYLRVSEGIMDKLYATALCIDGGEGQDIVIFCSADLGNFNNEMIENCMKCIAEERPDIPADGVVFNCTHNHSCADGRPNPEKTPDGVTFAPYQETRKFLIRQLCDAVYEAYDSRKEGGMAYGYGYAVVAQSRRSVYFEDMAEKEKNYASPNGKAIMYGRTNRPEFSHYEAGADHFLNVMFTVDTNEKVTGIVVNVPCPSQLSEHFTRLSADYWNEVREGVARDFGADVYVLPQCAAAGDLSPRILHYLKAQERRMALKYDLPYDLKEGIKSFNKCMGERKDIGERICAGIRDVYSWARKDIYRQIPVKVMKLAPVISARKTTEAERDACVEALEKLKAMIPDPNTCTPEEYRRAASHYQSVKARNEVEIRCYDLQGDDPKYQTTVFAVRVGDIAFATNEFELYMDFQHRIQARSPFIQTFVVQLASMHYSGYLPTQRGMDGKGYSACIFDNRVGAKGGQELVEATLEALQKLSED